MCNFFFLQQIKFEYSLNNKKKTNQQQFHRDSLFMYLLHVFPAGHSKAETVTGLNDGPADECQLAASSRVSN